MTNGLSSKNHRLVNIDILVSAMFWLVFVISVIGILSFELIYQRNYPKLISACVPIIMISTAVALYIINYQKRLLKNHVRSLALLLLSLSLLAATKIAILFANQPAWATGTAIAIGMIMVIAYDQRTALGFTIFYCLLASLAAEPAIRMNLFLTIAAGAATCCFSLREIRTRMKLLEVSSLATAVVFLTSISLGYWSGTLQGRQLIANACYHAIVTFVVGLLIQGLLPFIEKHFKIATSMTLLDYSDANQPLLKRLAMEAPGTFSHSLFVGSIAEAAAESIGRNGLLCRVGSYYHDIGKINKPGYFVENEIGKASRHKELSPAMSQLIISGHVKDGIEMAKEYGLPAVLRQFIETHHGTTLIAYFFHEAKKKQDEKQPPPSESEFRYMGPKPRTKEAAIVMLADSSEGAVRSLPEITPPKIENVVHGIAIKRLQDGQFDECELTLHELSQIEKSISKALAAHYHGRIAYPKEPESEQKEDVPDHEEKQVNT